MRTTPAQQLPPGAVLEYNSQAIALPRGEVHLGRSVGSFLRIDDPAVSRDHLSLRISDTIVAQDLGSTNGTLINGHRLTGSLELCDGDTITVGSRTFTVRLYGSAAGPEPEVTAPISVPELRRRTVQTPTPALEQTCPNCGPIPFNATSCPSCGLVWPVGLADTDTETTPDNPAVPEIRTYGRYSVQLGVRYTSKRMRAEGVVHELSRGGAFIFTSSVDTVGAKCRLILYTPDGDAAELDGVVRRVIHKGVGGRMGMGIEFTSLSTMNARWIAERMLISCQDGGHIS